MRFPAVGLVRCSNLRRGCTLQNGEMSKIDITRYAQLLGMKQGAEGAFSGDGLPLRSTMARNPFSQHP